MNARYRCGSQEKTNAGGGGGLVYRYTGRWLPGCQWRAGEWFTRHRRPTRHPGEPCSAWPTRWRTRNKYIHQSTCPGAQLDWLAAHSWLVIPELCGLDVERARVVWLAHETLERDEYSRDAQHRGPLLLEDVEADVAVQVHVRVVARRLEPDLWRRERVRRRELQRDGVRLAGVVGALCKPVIHVSLLSSQVQVGHAVVAYVWAVEATLPLCQVRVRGWERADPLGRGHHQRHQLTLKPAPSETIVSTVNHCSYLDGGEAYRLATLAAEGCSVRGWTFAAFGLSGAGNPARGLL